MRFLVREHHTQLDFTVDDEKYVNIYVAQCCLH